MAKSKFTPGVEEWAKSVYNSVFGKNVPDEFAELFNHWVEELENGNLSFEAFVENAVFSKYVDDKNLSNKEFLDLLYKIMEVKKPTDYDFWYSKFETRSRKGVLNGLFLTENWAKFCGKYEVN